MKNTPIRLKNFLSPISPWLTAGILSGVWAGMAVGMLEGTAVAVLFDNLSEKAVFYWGMLAYALLGAALGCGIGLLGSVAALFSRKPGNRGRTWGLCTVALFTPLAFIIARFRLMRDVLHERPLAAGESALLVLGFILLAAVLYWVVRLLMRFRVFQICYAGFGAPVIWVLVVGGAFGYYKIAEQNSLAETPTGVAQPFQPSPNVIFIMADALRADHLPVYGYSHIKTPALQALAADGITFEHHIAQSSWTKPQSATLLTSLYPSAHNTYLKPHALPGDIETLAEVMRATGYATGGIVSNVNLSPIFNFHQGFEHYRYLSPDYLLGARESAAQLCLYNLLRLVRMRILGTKKRVGDYYQCADVVNQGVFSWLEQVTDKPFFLFMHYMDPHDPYFAHPYSGEAVARVSQPNPPPDQAGYMRRLYDQEIVYMDSRLGQLVSFLKERSLYDSCLIVFVADHGEEFYDHDGWWHGTSLYEEVVHVPLIVKLPHNRRAGTRDPRLVRSVDIAPTIIECTGSAVPPAMQGVNFLANDSKTPVRAYAEEDHEHNVLHALREERWKLILTTPESPRTAPPVQLFDLSRDPHERENVADANPQVVDRMQRDIEDIQARIRRDAYQEQAGKIDRATQDRLKALGYVR